MKRILTLLIAIVMVSGFTVSVHAVLIDNFDGTVTQNKVVKLNNNYVEKL